MRFTSELSLSTLFPDLDSGPVLRLRGSTAATAAAVSLFPRIPRTGMASDATICATRI